MSRLLHPIPIEGAVVIAAAQSGLPFLPSEHGSVLGWDQANGRVGEFDLSVWAPATNNLTDAELFACLPIAGAIADDDVDTVDFANNELDLAAHAYATGDGPLRLTTTGTLPTGLALATDYYAIYKDAGTIQLATSLANALAKTAVAFSDVGSGTHTIEDTASTKRMHYLSLAKLGHAGDGAVALTARAAYVKRFAVHPGAVAYALKATLSASTASAAMFPVISR